jgi:hypothetical protein
LGRSTCCTDRIIFFHGSTWRPELNRFLADVPLSQAERHAIARGNAERLLLGL